MCCSYGAAYCVTAKARSDATMGVECCYDFDVKLITQGTGVGAMQRTALRVGWPLSNQHHCYQDIVPELMCGTQVWLHDRARMPCAATRLCEMFFLRLRHVLILVCRHQLSEAFELMSLPFGKTGLHGRARSQQPHVSHPRHATGGLGCTTTAQGDGHVVHRHGVRRKVRHEQLQ